jgi:hypothetical protein
MAALPWKRMVYSLNRVKHRKKHDLNNGSLRRCGGASLSRKGLNTVYAVVALALTRAFTPPTSSSWQAPCHEGALRQGGHVITRSAVDSAAEVTPQHFDEGIVSCSNTRCFSKGSTHAALVKAICSMLSLCHANDKMMITTSICSEKCT